MTQPIPPPFTTDVLELQRRYAAHSLLVRGFVAGPQVQSEPPQKEFDLSALSVTPGQVANVIGEFPSAPLLAFIDNVPTPITATYNPVTGGTVVSVTAPQGTSGGPVQLVWPTKTLVSNRPLWVAEHGLELRQHEPSSSGEITVGLFDERPIEVHIGMRQLPADAVTWENHLLQLRVPPDVASGPVLVVTRTRVYRSARSFEQVQRKKTSS